MTGKPTYEELAQRVRELENLVSEYKGIGKILRREKENNALLQVIQAGVVVHSPDTEIVDCNFKALELLGLSRDELLGKTAADPYWKFVDAKGNSLPAASFPVNRVIATRLPIKDMTVGFCDASRQTPEWFSTSTVPAFDENGELEKVIVTFVDITQRKRAEEAVRESEERYRSMMESMDESAYICSSDFHIEYMNPAMAEKIGRDAVGEICHKAIHGLEEQCPWCEHEKVMKGKKIKREIAGSKEGEIYFVSHSPVFHMDGSISKLTVYRDITEIKNLQSRIQQAQKMESLGSLAGGIAHDFNNILFPIVGLSEMLMEDLPEGSLPYKNAKELLTAGRRGSELVKQILSFSRQSEDRCIPVQFQSILKEVLKLCRSTIPTDIKVCQEIQEDCGFIMANPTQLHQIAMNLITNAFHAIEPDHGKISVRLTETVLGDEDMSGFFIKPGRYVLLTVSDTGRGIHPALQDKIFDPYFTTKEKEKGTGLGLSVVFGIVRELGGDIKVYSEKGEGTAFHVYFPLMKKNVRNVSDEKAEPDPAGRENVLLVDDEEQIAQIEKTILERLGYKVTSCTDSGAALETFREKPASFDLVITDMAMPNMTGDRLARELMSIRPDIPVIICTGFSERINREKARSLGIKGFLMKPVVKSDMAREVRNVLDENKEL